MSLSYRSFTKSGNVAAGTAHLLSERQTHKLSPSMRSLIAIIVISSLLVFDLARNDGVQLKTMVAYAELR